MKTLAEVLWQDNEIEMKDPKGGGGEGDIEPDSLEANCLNICCSNCGGCLTIQFCIPGQPNWP